jgi:hypothetical protein
MSVFFKRRGKAPIFIHTVNITADNIWKYFKVTNESYYFKGNGSVFTTNNGGVSNSKAQTTLTALFDMDISFDYSYSSEPSYDHFTLNVAGTNVVISVSGATANRSYTGKLTEGQTIVLTYVKDSSGDKNDDKCTFSNMVITGEF